MNLWGIIKGLLVQDETDRTKELSLEVDPAATTGTRMTLKSAQTVDRTLDLPDADDTLMGKATVDVMTNKSYDADGIGNVLTNIEDENIKVGAAIDAEKIADGSVDNTEFQALDGVNANIQGQLDDKIEGPASATDNAIVRYDGITGKLADDSQWTIDDGGELSPVADATQDLGNSSKKVAVIWGTELHSDTSDLRLTTSGQSLILGVSDVDGGGASFSNIPQITVDAPNDYGFKHDDGTVSVGSFVDGTYGYYGTESNHPLAFFTNNGAAQVVLNTSGDFGIAQTGVPNARLDIKAPLANYLIALTQTENDFFVRFKLPSLAGSTNYTLPAADGSAGFVLTTDGLGGLTWAAGGGGGGANTNLSNLDSPTAINQHLLPDGQDTRDIGGTSSNAWRSGYFATSVGVYNGGNPNIALLDSGFIVPSGGTAQGVLTNTPTQSLALYTASATGSTGNMLIETGNATVNSGNISLQVGTASGTRGNILLSALEVVANVSTLRPTVTGGTLGTSAAHWRDLNIRDIFSFTAAGLDASWLRGTVTTSPSGTSVDGALQKATNSTTPLAIYSPNKAGTGATVPILIETGNSTSGAFNSGNISLQTGTSSGGARGSIQLDALQVTTNTDILPNAANARSVGSSATYFNQVNASTIRANSFAGVDATFGTAKFRINGAAATSPAGTGVDMVFRTEIEGDDLGIWTISDASAGSTASGTLVLETGNRSGGSAAATGSINVRTGNATGSGASGTVNLRTGTVSTGTRGDVNVNARALLLAQGTPLVEETNQIPVAASPVNQLDHGNFGIVRLQSSLAVTINGILAGREGQHLYIYNENANNLSFANESGSANAADRIITCTGGTVTSTGVSAHHLIYLGSRWVLFSDNL